MAGQTKGPPRSAQDDADWRRFEAEMADVRPLAGKPGRLVVPPPRTGRKSPGPPAVARAPVTAEQPRQALAARPCAGDAFAYAAAGLDKRVLRELGSGARPPEARLDLHGRTGAEADRQLEAFLRAALAAGRRVVLIVHGRGHGSGDAGPVIRTLVHERLTAGPLAAAVLALVSAPARWGGSGAALVLLRRSG